MAMMADLGPAASSVASFASSGGSSRSSGSKGRRYRTLNGKSNVDETLFGNNDKCAQVERDLPFLDNKKKCANGGAAKTKGNKQQEVIEVITKDMIRKLRVPREDPSGASLVLMPHEICRIQRASKVLSATQKDRLQDIMKAEKVKVQTESEERKNFMQQMELKRQHNEQLTDLEQEAKERSQYLLQKAQEQMEEQEDEIKKLNETILNAKCHAIRDAQLVEKMQIKAEGLEEDKRLDEMMESDRLRVLEEFENRDNSKRLERLQGARILSKQIEDREQHSLLEEEKRDQDTKAMLSYLEKLQEEDLQALVQKRGAQRQIMKDVAVANEDIRQINEKSKQREKFEDQKVMEYLKEKAEREEAFEKEKEKQKTEKEKEIARLRSQQERAKDKQAEKDALRAKRNQEEAEREWRKKEKEEAAKKSQTEEMLKAARRDQVANKDHFLAVQAARDRAEFERVLDAQREATAKDEVADLHMSKKRQDYAQDVRHQIKEKEKIRVLDRQNFFEEGIKLDQEAKERRQKLDEIKKRKLKELREAGVCDKYVNEVARRIEAPPPSLSNQL